jgi:hypothetical protein
MQQMNKSILWVLLLASSLQTSWAYSLAGPVRNGGDSWQAQNIGYGPPSDDIAPKNLGEEYRRNLPVMYYAFDQNFLDYFALDGAGSVDGAFAILNSLTNVDNYSTQLSEFPLESRSQNYQAQALGLFDLKSFTLGIMAEQMGLADPVHYTWTLHNRFLPPGGRCPADEEYSVVMRNFDYVSSPMNQLQYSPYVNNTLYSYQIIEVCSGAPVLAQSVPYSVDPLADIYSPVSSAAITWGDYMTGLTRDDVAGLRYLLTTNNVNWESVPPTSLLGVITTNRNSPQSFPPLGFVTTNANGFYFFDGNTNNGGYGYGDLAALIAFSKTNNLATVQAAYPGLVISSVSNSLVWSSNQTYSAFFAPPPVGSPYGSPPQFVIVTNYTGFWQSIYYYQFANLYTNHYYTNSVGQLQTQTFSAPTGSPFGSPTITNTTVKFTNQISGDFFVLPLFQTNVCPLDILDSSHFNVIATTNFLTSANTNFPTATNTLSVSNSIFLVTYFTNYSFAINPVTCAQVPGATGLYQGIRNLKYYRANYDSLIGQYFQPITNNYSMVLVTNSQTVVQHFQRIVTQPDFLFTAEDLTPGPASIIFQITYSSTVPPFNTANVLPALAGPGTINPGTRISFNKDGPLFFNTPASTMDGTSYFTQTPGGDIVDGFYQIYFIWATFDGTTNAPTVFPNGTSIANLENQVLIQVSPRSLPTGFTDTPYPPQTFTATGGSFTAPFSWSAANLPAGLTLSSGGVLSGTPAQAGTFDFTLILTDHYGRSVQWTYPITIQ